MDGFEWLREFGGLWVNTNTGQGVYPNEDEGYTQWLVIGQNRNTQPLLARYDHWLSLLGEF
jgi:hypothetical protein